MTPAGDRVRDTEAGRQAIAEQIARLKRWCEREEIPWQPSSSEPVPVPEATHVG